MVEAGRRGGGVDGGWKKIIGSIFNTRITI